MTELVISVRDGHQDGIANAVEHALSVAGIDSSVELVREETVDSWSPGDPCPCCQNEEFTLHDAVARRYKLSSIGFEQMDPIPDEQPTHLRITCTECAALLYEHPAYSLLD